LYQKPGSADIIVEKSGGKPAFLTLSCFNLKVFFQLERLSRF
jgi:hypothetical protein